MTTAQEQALLEDARAAAAAGGVIAMLEALHQAGVTDGLVRQLRARWPTLHETDADFILGEAVDAFYTAARGGTKVHDVVAYIWKAADHMASDHHARRQREAVGSLEDAPGVADPALAVLAGDSRPAHGDHEWRRQEALAHARRLLPRLGQANVQRVMSFVLDAVERGTVDLPNAVIADALGLGLETVRTSLSRGFRRLTREAKREGLASQNFEPASLGVPDESFEA
jgi:DNA-directed RNA polymerase specialized sigma24 family protein